MVEQMAAILEDPAYDSEAYSKERFKKLQSLISPLVDRNGVPNGASVCTGRH
jgi:hypothetical protein